MRYEIVRGPAAPGVKCVYGMRDGVAAIYLPEDQISQEAADALADVLTEASRIPAQRPASLAS